MALKSSKVYKVYAKLFVQSRFFFWGLFERNPPSVIQNYGEVSLIDDWSGFRGGFLLFVEVYTNYLIYRDYFMVGECVRFLFTSCEGSLNERVSAANE